MTVSARDILATIPMTPQLTASLARATAIASASGAGAVLTEHMLLALCDDADARSVLAASGVDAHAFARDIVPAVLPAGALNTALDPAPALSIAPELKRILDAASTAAQRGRRRDIDGAIVIAAIVGDGKTRAAEWLKSRGLSFEAAIKALQDALGGAARAAAPQVPSQPNAEDILAGARERVQARSNPGIAARPRAKSTETMSPAAQPSAAPPDTQVSVETPQPGGIAHSVPYDAAVSGAERRAEALDPKPADDRDGLASPPEQNYQGRPSSAPPSASPQSSQPSAPSPASVQPQAQPRQRLPRQILVAPPPIPPPGVGPGVGPVAGPAPSLSVTTDIGGPANKPLPRPAGQSVVQTSAPSNQAPAPRAVPVPRQPQRRDDAQLGARVVDLTQFLSDIPRQLRKGRPETIEIRIPKAELDQIVDGMRGSGAVWHQDNVVAKAVSIRMRSPASGILIETISPETHWLEGRPGMMSDDVAGWRWNLLAHVRGSVPIELIVSARSVGADGSIVETAILDHKSAVRVRGDAARAAVRFAAFALAIAIGFAAATYAPNFAPLISSYMTRGSGPADVAQ